MAYTHINTRGIPYYLHSRIVVLRNGRQQRIFFFAKEERRDDALDELPAGYEVMENPRTGLPMVRKQR